MTPNDGLAALLAEHAGWTFNDISDDYECICGERLGYQCQSDYAANKAQWKHQAAVIRAAGWVKGRKEWGVLYEGEREPDETSVDRDWLIDECITGVYGESETPPKLVRRTVTDWEEA